MTLADLRVGEVATVEDVRGARGVVRRLLEMGLLHGTRVEVVRVAPLGDSIELRLRSYALSIRRREAQGVVVSRVDASVSAPSLARGALLGGST